MHLETFACLFRSAVCKHTFCLDFKASASGAVDAQVIKSKQDGLVCMSIHRFFVCFGLLGVNAQAIKANQEGGLA